jgi:hypothetical protein
MRVALGIKVLSINIPRRKTETKMSVIPSQGVGSPRRFLNTRLIDSDCHTSAHVHVLSSVYAAT